MRLILPIYTTTARLLNGLVLRGNFREATSKKRHTAERVSASKSSGPLRCMRNRSNTSMPSFIASDSIFEAAPDRGPAAKRSNPTCSKKDPSLFSVGGWSSLGSAVPEKEASHGRHGVSLGFHLICHGLFESGPEGDGYPGAPSPAGFALRQNQTAIDPQRMTNAITKKHSLKAITNEDSWTALCTIL
jgi:hypothetical protein